MLYKMDPIYKNGVHCLQSTHKNSPLYGYPLEKDKNGLDIVNCQENIIPILVNHQYYNSGQYNKPVIVLMSLSITDK